MCCLRDLQERARKAAVHPTVDWLYAVLLAVQQLEEALLVAPTEEGAPAWSSLVADKASLPASQISQPGCLPGCLPVWCRWQAQAHCCA